MDGPFSCKDDDTNSSSSSGGGGGRFLGEQDDPASSLPHDHPAGAPAGAAPLYPAVTPSPDNKLNPASTAPARAAAASSSSSKRSSGGRRSVHRRVVSVPFADADGARAKGSGECAPPSDSWAWRKYGQKPIKGSPYPRGYYRCSSSKGCPARKQVERSRVDPTMLVVTYACEHNHPWPLPKTHHHHHHQQQQQQQQAAAMSPRKQTPPQAEPPVPGSLLTSSPASTDHEDSFARDLLVEGTPLAMMANDFAWFSDVSASPPPQEAFLGEPMCGGADDAAMMLVDEDAGGEGAAAGDDESSLFAGLGELPECAVVFRRGFLERQLRVQMEVEENPRRVGAAPCCGTTG